MTYQGPFFEERYNALYRAGREAGFEYRAGGRRGERPCGFIELGAAATEHDKGAYDLGVAHGHSEATRYVGKGANIAPPWKNE